MRSMVVGMMGGTVQSPETAEIWFDPSDLSSMWQEITGSSGFTPVAVGDPIGSIRNKGTVGGWATAPSTSNRPVLGKTGDLYYIKADINTSIQINLSAAQVSAITLQQLMFVIGWYVETTGTILGGSGSSSGENLHTGIQNAGLIRFATFGDNIDGPANESGNILVVTERLASTNRYIRKNGSQIASDTPATLMTGGSLQFFVGPLSSGGDERRIYGFVAKTGASIADSLRASYEQYMAGKTGLSFTST